jgi:hypothetical protein
MQKIRLFTPILAVALLLQVYYSNAQQDKSKRPSPPAKAEFVVGAATITIDYSQPGVKGRKIWGELVPYDKVWRTGANEATTFEVSKDVKVEGNALKAGKYGLFTIPGKDEWVIIFNSVPNQWGAYEYDENKDVLRVAVKPMETSESTERLTFSLEDNGMVVLKWEKLKVGFTVDG